MKWIFLLILTACSVNVFSQRVVVAATMENIVYTGVPNPIEVAVEGRSCKDFTVATDNGTLVEIAPGSYELLPKEFGIPATITVTDRRPGHKVLGTLRFRVKRIPDPIAKVGGKSGGDIRKNLLKAQLGIIAPLEGFGFDARWLITGFTITIYRCERPTFTKTCDGPRFPPEVIAAFNDVATYDRIEFSDIHCKSPDQRISILQPIAFRVID